MEKPCPCTGPFFPVPIALFYYPIGWKKVPALAVVFPHYEQDRSDRKLIFFKLQTAGKFHHKQENSLMSNMRRYRLEF